MKRSKQLALETCATIILLVSLMLMAWAQGAEWLLDWFGLGYPTPSSILCFGLLSCGLGVTLSPSPIKWYGPLVSLMAVVLCGGALTLYAINGPCEVTGNGPMRPLAALVGLIDTVCLIAISRQSFGTCLIVAEGVSFLLPLVFMFTPIGLPLPVVLLNVYLSVCGFWAATRHMEVRDYRKRLLRSAV